MSREVRHLYVHLPFCRHRCGYCDFVTVVGKDDVHGAYVEALLTELDIEGGLLAPRLETIFVGGGTPTYTMPEELTRLLAGLPEADEVTVEANPETVTPALARLLRDGDVTRVSLGAQSFQPELLGVLDRYAGPDDVRSAFYHLRDAGFDNISLDLIYGIPGQSSSDLERDLEEVVGLGAEHLSCYELEAKPGTRFTHAHGEALEHQAVAMEGYFELVVDVLLAAGYRWYETANFCRDSNSGEAPIDLRAAHNLAYWRGREYLGLGVGAVSTVGHTRWRTIPALPRYIAALERGQAPAREVEPLDDAVLARERLMLGLRLDEPLDVSRIEHAIDREALERLTRLGLIEERHDGRLVLTRRGRFLGGAVTAELMAEMPANQLVSAAPSGSIG